ncbi:MAG: sulfate transporter subunit [Isosphaera sp.]|nr:sulfate transporter subunit [Isosphaera sp.]
MWGRVLLRFAAVYVAAAAVWVAFAGFARNEQLLNVACDPTRELWRDVNAAFADYYERQHGVRPFVRQSHGGSGSQARSVIDGLPADVISLALWTDTDAVRKSGLLDAGWETRYPNRSLPYTSTIVFVVRKGNPKGVRDWADLARPDVEVITPSPKTSGNGKWSFLAMWGSVVWRGGTDAEARAFVTAAYRRVPVLDAAARGATMTFAQKNIGDVHLTWENEAHLEVKESGGALEIVYPPVSVLAEPHVAVVDANVRRKNTAAVADAYVEFLYTKEAQELIARHYHRPTDPAVFARHRGLFPELRLERATTLVRSGTWDDVQKTFFAEGAIFDQIQAAGR